MNSLATSVQRGVWVLCVVVALLSSVTMAAEPTAITVETGLGTLGTASELILCPLVGNQIGDPSWLYKAFPGSAAFAIQAVSPIAIPPAPSVTDLSQTWSPWNIAQNVVVDSNDDLVPMEQVLFDLIASTTATGPVVLYVYSEKPCPILRATEKGYREYLAGKGIVFSEIEKSTIPGFNEWVSGLNYLSPGNFTVPLLLINGDPVVGKWRASTQARIDKLLKKHGLIP